MPTTFIFNIHALKTSNQTIWEEHLNLEPSMKIEEYNSHDDSSRFVRLKVHKPIDFSLSYSAVVEVTPNIIYENNSKKSIAVQKLDSYIASFLYPSRYCQSDKLMKFAYKEFGDVETVYDKVVAITNWVNGNIDYVSGSTNSQTSAMDTITERAGVCRDFAHLSIALCRALSIPARYFTGYAYQLKPQDFHACFEAYMDGQWILFDPTGLAPLNGFVKIATGRDAADSAVTSIFGNATGTGIEVNCELAEGNFEGFKYDHNHLGVSYG